MAAYAGTGAIFQIQSTATAGNLNGGGFNPTNTHGITDGVIALGTGNSPTLTSATYSFVAGDVGYWIYFPVQANIISGWYQISSVSSGVATLSAAVGQAQIVASNMFGTNSVSGCATTAAPAGVTYLVDYSQSDTARYSNSALTGSTTTCTDATNPFTAQMVGNFITIASGTGVTAGFYEIVSVSAGTATIDRSAGASYSAGVCKIGGAASLGGSTTGITDVIFLASGGASTRYFLKGGISITYTPNAAIITTAGTTSQPAIYEGYAVTRGDRPMGTTRPTLACGSNVFTSASANYMYSLIFTGTASPLYAAGGAPSLVEYCKFINSSTTAGHAAASQSSAVTQWIGVEAVSYRGPAFNLGSQNQKLIGCYAHDSDTGISVNTSANGVLTDCIISSNVTAAFGSTTVLTSWIMNGNTFYGAENKLGTGINITTGTGAFTVMNNIFYGFATAVSHPDAQTNGIDDYNDYFNNTNDVNSSSNWQKGLHDISVNPSFASVSQITGTGATSSTTVLTDGGKNFTTAGVVAGRDYLQIVSATGVTLGQYGITAVGTTTITTDASLGTGSAITYQITTGRNFAVGTNLKATGYPGVFPAALTTGYLDIGAAQRQETGGGGGGSFTFGS